MINIQKNLSKHRLLKLVTSIILLTLVSYVFLNVFNKSNVYAAAQTRETYSEKINNAHLNRQIDNNYTLINIDGSVRLYRNETLIQIFDTVNPYSLPLQDQDNLKTGIKIKSVEEAMQLIEDFDG